MATIECAMCTASFLDYSVSSLRNLTVRISIQSIKQFIYLKMFVDAFVSGSVNIF